MIVSPSRVFLLNMQDWSNVDDINAACLGILFLADGGSIFVNAIDMDVDDSSITVTFKSDNKLEHLKAWAVDLMKRLGAIVHDWEWVEISSTHNFIIEVDNHKGELATNSDVIISDDSGFLYLKEFS